MAELTPMIQQYQQIKAQHRDAILLFRLGDFYEMFFDDAERAAKLLDLTLTARNKEKDVPLCGIPHHAAQGYINRLLEQGLKVAICEQVEDPKKAKGIVKREVVQVFSPGMILDPGALEETRANYLAAVCYRDGAWGLALCDISTGMFKLTMVSQAARLLDELIKHQVRELLIEDHLHQEWVEELRAQKSSLRINQFGPSFFDPQHGANTWDLSREDVRVRAGYGLLTALESARLVVRVEGGALLNAPVFYEPSDYMEIDETTRANLEIFHNLHDRKESGSLFAFLNQCETAMGARLLREWLMCPLMDVALITSRQDAVAELLRSPERLELLGSSLRCVADLERIQNRVLTGRAHGRDLLGLGQTLEIVSHLREQLGYNGVELLRNISEHLDPMTQLRETITTTLRADCPFAVKEGGLIRAHVSEELDELRNIETNGKATISKMEITERERTGINSLKIRYNRVFGYYIEITHTHRERIPADYTRKQTLANAERYVTPELKEYENRVLGASERIKDLEYEIFCELRVQVAERSIAVKKLAHHLAMLDVLVGLARVARQHNLTRPTIVEQPIISIEQSRHPLVAATSLVEDFVPNDLYLDTEEQRLLIITGPNMAGKSTIMRQVALISYMAQVGSYVPAMQATIGLVDRLFTRIGAADHLQKGQSTFMVEMLETAAILKRATERSLIVLDELGRGTSTFDGLSLAWAIAETIHDQIRARSLFATHYHELTDLAQERSGVKNFHMGIKEVNGRLCFLRELKPGGSNRSYGVHVAAMAGLPQATITRAREILKILEKKDLAFQAETQQGSSQQSLFDIVYDHPLIHELKDLNLDRITPLDALHWLVKAQREI